MSLASERPSKEWRRGQKAPCSGLLRRLDRLLAGAVEAVRREAAGGALPFYRGLFVGDDEVDELLRRPPAAPRLWRGDDRGAGAATADESCPALGRLGDLFELSDLERDAVAIALAPELDLKYERLFAYLQDDLTKRRPTVDLVLHLLCRSAAERIDRRRCFTEGAPLIDCGLLHLGGEGDGRIPLPARTLHPDPVVTRFLLRQPGPDARYRRRVKRVSPRWTLERLPLPAGTRRRLAAAAAAARSGQPVRIRLVNGDAHGRRLAAEGLAHACGASLSILDLPPAGERVPTEEIRPALLEAVLEESLPYVRRFTGPLEDRLELLVGSTSGPLVFDGPCLDVDDERAVTVRLDRPRPEERHVYWSDRLGGAEPLLGSDGLALVADRFDLSFEQIHRIAAEVREETRVTGAQPTVDEVMRLARAHSSGDLADLAERIEARQSWDALVLGEEALSQLHELCDRATRRTRVVESWGYGRRLRGTGTSALFVGPSGTGKTLAAEIVAHELGLNLYRIDLAGVVSKYIGETEKNLDRIFTAAERSNAVLLFDEADALFGKRSLVRDAHDRYANIEVAYLLQRVERYPGVAILTTNLSHNLDEAFIRRLALTIRFPFPGVAERRRIWEVVWPPEAPLAEDFDPERLARRYKLSGAGIHNAALAAAFGVEDDAGPITMDHVRHAVRREFQKMGKVVGRAALEDEGVEVTAT